MLFQVLCGFEPVFYTTHPNEEPLKFTFPELGHTWFISIMAVCYLLTILWVREKDNRKFWNIHWLIYGAVIVGFSTLGQLTSAIYTAHVLLFSMMFYIGNKNNFVEPIRGGAKLNYCLLRNCYSIADQNAMLEVIR